MTAMLEIRAAIEADLAHVSELEERSDQSYLALDGFDALMGHPNFSARHFADLAAGYRLFVAEGDGLLGFVWTEPVDDCAFVHQVSVVPEAQGQGLGTALMDAAYGAAIGDGFGGLTLATFRDVPWNMPFYARRGFQLLSEDEIGPELRARAAKDRQDWGEFGARVVMGRFF